MSQPDTPEMSVALGFVRQMLNDVLGTKPADVVPHAMLVEDLGADSLDMVEIQMIFEERDVLAPDAVFHSGTKVSDLANLVLVGTCARCEGTGSIHKRKGGFAATRLAAVEA